MTSTTTTVETLTAEVRTLVVGRRQVTLSVFRQLDTRPLEDIDPFGRVRDRDQDDLLIGRERETGALVRSKFYRGWSPVLRRATVMPEELEGGQVTVCRTHLRDPDVTDELTFDGCPIQFIGEAAADCGIIEHHWLNGNAACARWHTNGHDDRIRAVVSEHRELREKHLAAAQLPLIVLAGLK